jgi:2-dehydropantoate 2-reductase
MTDLVVGGGAVGTLVAWALAAGGREVAIVRRRLEGPPRRAVMAVVDRAGRRHEASATEVRAPSDLAAAPDLIVFAVKMFDLPAAVESCAGWPSATALTLSNGIGAEEIVAERRAGGLIAGSVTSSVEVAPDGAVVRLNRGGIALAAARGGVQAAALVDALVAAFGSAGLRAVRRDDARAMKWSKLVANLVANATSAILDITPSEIYADPGTYRIERRQLLEAFAVMRRLGLEPVSLPGADVRLLRLGLRLPDVIGRTVIGRVVAGARGGKSPSLRLHAGSSPGPTEVGWLNGAVAREADRLGGRAPVNARLTELVAEVVADPDRRTWFRDRPDRLVTAVAAIAGLA